MTMTLINILGAGRSGTTMLDLMMGNDEESFSMGEVFALYRPHRKHHFLTACNCGDPQCIYWNKLKKLNEKEFHLKSFEILDVNYIVDSSKYLPWVIDSYDNLSYQNVNIINFLIYKPLVSYCYSIWKRGDRINQAIKSYKKYYNRVFQTGLMTYAVSFNELVNQPDQTLQKLCSLSGQVYTAERKEFWNKEHHHLFGSAGTTKQSREGKSRIKANEDFPIEYEKLIPEIQQFIEKDKGLNTIIRRLVENDFKRKLNDFENKESTVIKPLWYYLSKTKNIYKSIFPY